MNKATLINQSNIPESLVEAVINQIGDWESFTESAIDISNHGIDGGFSGFIYYTDTIKFAEDNKADILTLTRDMADDMGVAGAYSLIAGFNCLLGMTADRVADTINDPESDDYTHVMNGLAWFAGEEVSRAYTDALGE